MTRHGQDRQTMQRRRRRPAGRAFTLVELLVIIIILSMLITMVTPSVLKARELARYNESKSILTMLDKAVTQFRTDLGVLPPSNGKDWPYSDTPGVDDLRDKLKGAGLTGRHALYEALTGHLDATKDFVDGWGLRRVARGKIYPEFVPNTLRSVGDPDPAFVDAFGNEILYYCLAVDANTFHLNENTAPAGVKLPAFPRYVQYMDKANKLRFYRADFVLLSPGADTVYDTPTAGKTRTDDLANFLFRFPKK